MENTPEIHNNHRSFETERRWQTLASILGVMLTATITCIGLSWVISRYMEYHLFSYTLIEACRLTFNIIAICIMISFVIYLWSTRNGTNGFKTEFWATMLSFILTTGSIVFLFIDAYVKFDCIDILQEHNCPLIQYLISLYCDITFLIIQFFFLHFTNMQVIANLKSSYIRYFSKYFCLTLLVLANYSVWLAWALSEFSLFTFEKNEHKMTALPCNVTIPYNSTSLVSSCLKFAESEDHIKLREKAAIFLFGCILENCLLSTSHHWYKFISLNATAFNTSVNTSMFKSSGLNEPSWLLEHSINANSISACNNVDMTDAHSTSIHSKEEECLLSTADDQIGESSCSENAVSFSSVCVNSRSYDNLNQETIVHNEVDENKSNMPIVLKCIIMSNIAYMIYVIVLRVKDFKSYSSILVFEILTTTVHALSSFIPNLIATCIICTGDKIIDRAPRTNSLQNEQHNVSHLNKVILFLSAAATCLIFLLGFMAGYHGRDMCIHNHNHHVFNNMTCKPLDYNLLIYQNAYYCIPFILQLFVVLNIQSVKVSSKNINTFRHCLTVVAFCNITFWATDSFTSSFKESQTYQNMIFGESNWFVIMHVIYPCFTFYRMYSFEIFIEYSSHHLPKALSTYRKQTSSQINEEILSVQR